MPGAARQSTEPARRGRGRPRDTSKDTEVLKATLRLLASEGVAGMSMDRVAAEAGVAKVTVYARWRTKNELIGAALSHLRVELTGEPTGDVRADLIALLTGMSRGYEEVGGLAIILNCMATAPASDEFVAIIREATLLPRRASFVRVLDEGVAAGRLRPDVNPEQVTSMLIGMLYADHLAGRTTEPDWAESVVDVVLRGIMAG
ncbi:TetR/AcrR family transcriptional regulator [Streptomyces sp. NPDC058464]|uniref:TetR/AcrR family transcriptional regulator n=1 Tax=Streptomyces sp. NPDC058464 TaxID=3346511 RepID=UPI0036567236